MKLLIATNYYHDCKGGCRILARGGGGGGFHTNRGARAKIFVVRISQILLETKATTPINACHSVTFWLPGYCGF